MEEVYTISHNVEYQLAGALLRGGDSALELIDRIEADKFHNSIVVDIVKACKKLRERGMMFDVITVGDELEKDGKINSVHYGTFSGRAAIGQMKADANPKQAKTYRDAVIDYWGKRQVFDLASRQANWARNGRTAKAICSDIINEITTVESAIGHEDERTLTAAQAASMSYDASLQAASGKRRYHPTGLADLDSFFKIRPKTLTIIAARPGKGKSGLLVTIVLNNARHKLKSNSTGKILFLSLEMSVEEVTARFLSQICGVPASQIMDGEMNEQEWSEHAKAIEEFEKLPIIINDIPAMSMKQISAKARRWLPKSDENMLVVDYLQLATSGDANKKRYEEVGAISRGLKALSGELEIAVIAAAAMSRNIEQRAEKRPQLSDLRESGDIEADANNVLFIHDAENANEDSSIRRLIVGKQRNGADSTTKGDVIVRFRSELTRFESVTTKTIQLS
jgi:replicative DNA helicase